MAAAGTVRIELTDTHGATTVLKEVKVLPGEVWPLRQGGIAPRSLVLLLGFGAYIVTAHVLDETDFGVKVNRL